MNRLAAILTILVVAAGVSANEDVPHCSANNSWQVYPDSTDCGKFYRCEHNKAVSHNCVENTLYDKELRACNWDHLVNCDANPNLQVLPPLVCPVIEDNPNRPTHLEHPTDCGKFYKCWDGTPVEMDCPSGYLWNQVLLYCDFPKNVPCGNRMK